VEQLTSRPSQVTADHEIEHAYARLRRIAGKLMQDERAGHTLWPTEVVHEAIARLLEHGERLDEPADLLDVISHAARIMTQVLVDHARRRAAEKRGGGRARVSLDDLNDLETAIERDAFDWDALDHAMRKMKQHDPRRHDIVTLRFFGGLNNRQIARQLGIDESTVGRDWAGARAWLRKQLQEAQP
jgi:RNA polymerase sigma factor (TIGR02999 family)